MSYHNKSPEITVVLANLEVADKLGGCLPSFDSDVRHFSVVLTAAFVVVRSSQNCITSQGSHYSQATVGLNVAVNITQGVRDDGLSRKPTSADSIIGTSAAPHKGIFGAIPSDTWSVPLRRLIDGHRGRAREAW